MKKLKFFLICLLAVCMAAVFAGCGHLPESSVSAPLDTAQSAEQESIGNSPEWRQYQEALSDGYVGSFLDFLIETGVTVSDDTAAVNAAMTSVVSIESIFTPRLTQPESLGSGVIWSLDTARGDAYIVTNYHVVYGQNAAGSYGLAHAINVYLYGGYVQERAVGATFYGGEMEYDVAVLKVSDCDLLKATQSNTVYAKAAVLGDSQTVTAGERVYALGNANGEGFSVTGGIVSVPYETIEVLRADDRVYITLPEIRIDAAINHGNSGGGLFNAQGELIGIVNARCEGGVEYVGYAIPLETVGSVVGRIIR